MVEKLRSPDRPPSKVWGRGGGAERRETALRHSQLINAQMTSRSEAWTAWTEFLHIVLSSFLNLEQVLLRELVHFALPILKHNFDFTSVSRQGDN